MRSTPIFVLGVLAALLVVLILSGTIYAFVSGSSRKGAEGELQGSLEEGEGFFEGLGSIRAKTADKDVKIVVVSISCLYDASDVPFSEELTSKASALRKVAEKFFSEKAGADLNPAFEGKVKAELRDGLNTLLVLGKIKALYFVDFAVIE